MGWFDMEQKLHTEAILNSFFFVDWGQLIYHHLHNILHIIKSIHGIKPCIFFVKALRYYSGQLLQLQDCNFYCNELKFYIRIRTEQQLYKEWDTSGGAEGRNMLCRYMEEVNPFIRANAEDAMYFGLGEQKIESKQNAKHIWEKIPSTNL